jgi:hypothetical protein
LFVRLSSGGSWVKSVSVAPGTSIDYMWTSSNGSSYTSTYSASPATGPCGGSSSGTWVANDSGNTSLNNTVAACQAGFTYTLTYIVDGGAATDSVTVAVSNSYSQGYYQAYYQGYYQGSYGGSPTGSLTISPNPCTITSPATTCSPVPNVKWSTSTSFAQILVSKKGEPIPCLTPVVLLLITRLVLTRVWGLLVARQISTTSSSTPLLTALALLVVALPEPLFCSGTQATVLYLRVGVVCPVALAIHFTMRSRVLVTPTVVFRVLIPIATHLLMYLTPLPTLAGLLPHPRVLMYLVVLGIRTLGPV